MNDNERLFEACKTGLLDEVQKALALRKFLIFKRMDVNAVDKDGCTPLYIASANGHKDIAELLVAKGADVMAVNNNGWSPLHIASANGHKDIAELLVAKGADVKTLQGSVRTPRGYATGTIQQPDVKREVNDLLRQLEGLDVPDQLVPTDVRLRVRARLIEIGTPAIPVLIEALRHHDVTVRWYAVKWLAECFGDPQAVPGLLELLLKEKNDHRERTIIHIVEALGRIGDTRAVHHLEDLLLYPNWRVKEASQGALKKTSSILQLVETLRAKNSLDRSHAAETLRDLGWLPQTDEQKLLFYLGNMDVDILVHIGLPAVSGLLEILKDPGTRSYTREQAVKTLARVGSPEAIPGLLAAMAKDESDREFNAIVANALRQLNWQPQTTKERIILCKQIGSGWDEMLKADASAVPELLGVMKDEMEKGGGYTTCKGIIAALGRLRDKRAVPGLVEAMRHQFYEEAALLALRQIGWQPETIDEKLVYYTVTENWNELVKIGKPAVPVLLPILKPTYREFSGAVEALGRIGDPEVVPSLTKWLSSSCNFRYKIEIIAALGSIRSPQAVPELIEVIHRRDDEGWMVAEAAIRALGRIGDTQAVPALLKVLREGGERSRTILPAVIIALGIIGDKQAIPDLTNTLQDTDPELRSVAQAALDRFS
jgi:HEAT repeat protein